MPELGRWQIECPIAGLRSALKRNSLFHVSVQEIKEQLAALPQRDQDEVVAYLFHLRHAQDVEFQREIARRTADRDPSHWLSPEDFERKLDAKETR